MNSDAQACQRGTFASPPPEGRGGRSSAADHSLQRSKAILLLLVAGLLAGSPFASAEVTQRDLQIVARTLGFLDPPLTGVVQVGIIHDPAQPATRQQAEAIAALMGNGLQAGNLVLQPQLVALPDAMTAAVRFYLLPDAIGSSASSLQDVMQDRQLPCLTTDIDQVMAGHCAVGIQSLPKVEIVVNREQAASSEVKFATAFRMMIREF